MGDGAHTSTFYTYFKHYLSFALHNKWYKSSAFFDKLVYIKPIKVFQVAGKRRRLKASTIKLKHRLNYYKFWIKQLGYRRIFARAASLFFQKLYFRHKIPLGKMQAYILFNLRYAGNKLGAKVADRFIKFCVSYNSLHKFHFKISFLFKFLTYLFPIISISVVFRSNFYNKLFINLHSKFKLHFKSFTRLTHFWVWLKQVKLIIDILTILLSLIKTSFILPFKRAIYRYKFIKFLFSPYHFWAGETTAVGRNKVTAQNFNFSPFLMFLKFLLFKHIRRKLYSTVTRATGFFLSQTFGHKAFLKYFLLSNVQMATRAILSYALRRLRFRYTISQIFRFMLACYRSLVRGFRLYCLGRFNRRQRAHFIKINFGKIALGTHSSKTDYSFGSVPLKYGVSSLKIWFNRKNFIPKKLIFFENEKKIDPY